jgi:RNA polymerase sigma-70 factor (ECF subfamily)
MMTVMDESPKPPPQPGDAETQALIDRAVRGDQGAWGELLARHRDRLRRMVALRLDRRLQGRVDASDVIQEAMLDASRRLAEFRQNPTMPFFLWLRYLTGQRLLEQHRRHLGAQGRDVGREISLYRGAMPETTTAALAAQLLGRHTSPSQAAQRAERKIRLQESLNSLDPLDREILALRHFEHLSNAEAAEVLRLDRSAASKRYARALVRLKDILASRPGGFGEF